MLLVSLTAVGQHGSAELMAQRVPLGQPGEAGGGT